LLYSVDFAHSSSSMTLKFTSTLDEPAYNESWGMRDLYIYTCLESATCPVMCEVG